MLHAKMVVLTSYLLFIKVYMNASAPLGVMNEMYRVLRSSFSAVVRYRKKPNAVANFFNGRS